MSKGVVSRRDLLAAAGWTAAAAGLAACAPKGRAAADTARETTAATYIPPSYSDLYPGIEAFAKAAAEHSGGRLVLDLFDAGTLLGAEQLLPGLLLGAADVIFQTSSYVSSSYPILGALELPFITEDYATQRRAAAPGGPYHALVNERLAPRGVRLLGGMPTSFEYLWTVDRPIRRPADVRGMRIRVAGEIEGETVKALGGAPVFMGSAEVYQALERRTIDGMMSYVGTVVSRNLQDIIRYGTVAHFGAYTIDAYCRTDWYERHDPETRRALDAAGRAVYTDGTDAMVAVHTSDYLPAVEAGGVELVELGEAEQTRFREAVAPVYDRWKRRVGEAAAAAAVASVRNA